MFYDIFSKREKRQSAGADIYQYTEIPQPTKVQIVYLWKRSIGIGEEYMRSNDVYVNICKILREEYGVFHLCNINNDRLSGLDELANFFLQEKNIKRCFDPIELAMRAANQHLRDEGTIEPANAESLLNFRLREAGIGYQFEGGEIIKVDNQLIHSEIVKPSIIYLSDAVFKGANTEFMEAHRNYKAGDYKACLVEALKAFESTMKIICRARKWATDGDTASRLIVTILANGLIPPYLQTQFGALKSVLESGIPTVRNKTAGHGQGDQIQEVPEYLAAYVLHQTAAAILFLVKAHKEKA